MEPQITKGNWDQRGGQTGSFSYNQKDEDLCLESGKNDRLKVERAISFEEVVLHIQIGNEVDIYDHPNQERYPGQKISVVLIEGYAYLVPFVENEEKIFLKTIIPSRKATQQYSGGSHE